MEYLANCPALQSKLGNEALHELQSLLQTGKRELREDMLEAAGDRFERRLTQETGALRQAMHELRVEITKELSTTRVEIIRWSFVFWVTQLTAMAGLVAFLR